MITLLDRPRSKLSREQHTSSGRVQLLVAAALLMLLLHPSQAQESEKGASDLRAVPQGFSTTIAGAGTTWLIGRLRLRVAPTNEPSHMDLRRQYVFHDVLAELITNELRRVASRHCTVRAINAPFSDIEIGVYIGYKPGPDTAIPSSCLADVQSVISNHASTTEEVAYILRQRAGLKRLRSNPTDQHAPAYLATEIAKQIYDQQSIAHAILSVSEEDYSSAKSGDFVDWLANLRIAGAIKCCDSIGLYEIRAPKLSPYLGDRYTSVSKRRVTEGFRFSYQTVPHKVRDVIKPVAIVLVDGAALSAEKFVGAVANFCGSSLRKHAREKGNLGDYHCRHVPHDWGDTSMLIYQIRQDAPSLTCSRIRTAVADQCPQCTTENILTLEGMVYCLDD